MSSDVELDDTKPKEEISLTSPWKIIMNILLVLSPLWVPYALIFFELLVQFLPFKNADKSFIILVTG